jgi:rhamnogalacturonan endolyase
MWYNLLIGLMMVAACSPRKKDNADPDEIGTVLYEDAFDVADSSLWIVESETPVDLQSSVFDGALVLDVPGGITVWNTTRFKGNVMFEFDVTVVKAGGENDRVSDLNCFWMATDPDFPNDFFKRSSWRAGKFWNYYSLNLYYAGYGGHNNTKTRMRRYDADIPPPPAILKEYDDPSHLIEPNQRNTIRIVCFGSRVLYFFNGEKIFDITDDDPYKEGYFGFRTTKNHMKIHHFKVSSVIDTAGSLLGPQKKDE